MKYENVVEFFGEFMSDYIDEEVWPRGERSPLNRLNTATNSIHVNANSRDAAAKAEFKAHPDSASANKKHREMGRTASEDKALGKIAKIAAKGTEYTDADKGSWSRPGGRTYDPRRFTAK